MRPASRMAQALPCTTPLREMAETGSPCQDLLSDGDHFLPLTATPCPDLAGSEDAKHGIHA
jgi:hypothetical protein